MAIRPYILTAIILYVLLKKPETNPYIILTKILFCFWNNLLILESYTLNKFNYKLL